MNNTKQNPKGVDKQIDIIQSKLYKMLSSKGAINSFPRAYVLPHKDEGYVLQHHLRGDEYQDILRNDDSRFFFYLNPTVNVSDQSTATVGIVFMVDLGELCDSEVRNDEGFRNSILSLLDNTNFKTETINIGVEYLKSIMGRVFGARGRAKDVFYSTNFEIDDMHPYHIFTIEGQISYSYNHC